MEADPFAETPDGDPFAQTADDPFAETGAPDGGGGPDPTPEPPATPPPSDPDDAKPVPTDDPAATPAEQPPVEETSEAGPVEPSPEPEPTQPPAEEPQPPVEEPQQPDGNGAAQEGGKTPTRPYVILARVAEGQEVEVPGGGKIKGTLWIEVDDRVEARNNGHAQKLAYHALGAPPKVRVATVPDASVKGGGQGWNPKTIEPEAVPERTRLKIS